jgi:hypothetical protein
MNIDPSIFLPYPLSLQYSDGAAENPNGTRWAGIQRAERNVRVWSAYLPPECVNLMIRMGWDQST